MCKDVREVAGRQDVGGQRKRHGGSPSVGDHVAPPVTFMMFVCDLTSRKPLAPQALAPRTPGYLAPLNTQLVPYLADSPL